VATSSEVRLAEQRVLCSTNEGGFVKRHHIAVAGVIAGLLAVPAPAMANNDPFSPGDDCSGNPQTIGQPAQFGGINATEIVEFLGGDNPVDGAASAANPGVSTWAKGQVASGLNCL
jgi:hypothetical protein